MMIAFEIELSAHIALKHLDKVVYREGKSY